MPREPRRVRVDRILFPDPVPAGMNSVVALVFGHRYRTTTEENEPIEIRPVDGTRFYRIADGRHRFVGCLLAGRRHVVAFTED